MSFLYDRAEKDKIKPKKYVIMTDVDCYHQTTKNIFVDIFDLIIVI